jgi:hypothetical protein
MSVLERLSSDFPIGSKVRVKPTFLNIYPTASHEALHYAVGTVIGHEDFGYIRCLFGDRIYPWFRPEHLQRGHFDCTWVED